MENDELQLDLLETSDKLYHQAITKVQINIHDEMVKVIDQVNLWLKQNNISDDESVASAQKYVDDYRNNLQNQLYEIMKAEQYKQANRDENIRLHCLPHLTC